MTLRRRLSVGQYVTGLVVIVAALVLPRIDYAARSSALRTLVPPCSHIVAFPTTGGLAITGSGTEAVEVLEVRSRSGLPVRIPKVALAPGRLAYYSPDDEAICVIDDSQAETWLSFSVDCPAERISSLGFSGAHVLVNVDGDKTRLPADVWVVDHLHARRVVGARYAIGGRDATGVAVLDTGGNLWVSKHSARPVTTTSARQRPSVGYDSSTGLVVMLGLARAQLIEASSAALLGRSLPTPGSWRGWACSPTTGWVDVTPYGLSAHINQYMVDEYDILTMRPHGARVRHSDPIRSPVQTLSPSMAAHLRRVLGGGAVNAPLSSPTPGEMSIDELLARHHP